MFNAMQAPVNYLLSIPRASIEDIESELKHINPWGDYTLDELYVIKVNVVREYRIRTGHFRKTYWQRLSFDEQVIAEAEAQYLRDLFASIRAAEQCYIIDNYLDADMAKFDAWLESGQLAKDVHTAKRGIKVLADYVVQLESGEGNRQILQENEILEGTSLSGGTISLVPPNDPTHLDYNEYLLAPSFNREPPILVSHVTTSAQKVLTLWRDKLSGIQTEAFQHWSTWLLDVVNHQHMNLITGKAGAERILLANTGVPVPKPESFLAWMNMCGIVFRKLHSCERLHARRMAGFKPESIFTYMLPAMPMTKEHQSHSLIQTVDSTADHSLSGKSKAHNRDEYERILYGQWRVRTVLLGYQPGQVYIVADEPLSTLERRPLSLHESHLDMLPHAHSTDSAFRSGASPDWLFPDVPLADVGLTVGCIADPSVSDSALPVAWAYSARSLSVPWASLSKDQRIHFRFSWDQEGSDSASLWMNHFENAAWLWAHASKGQRFNWQIKAMVEHIRYLRDPSSVTPTQTKTGSTVFDLSRFDF